MKKSFSFKGRINQKEYIISLIIFAVLTIILRLIFYKFDYGYWIAYERLLYVLKSLFLPMYNIFIGTLNLPDFLSFGVYSYYDIGIFGARGIQGRYFSYYHLIFSILIWFRLAQGAKRCHDIGKSGWFQLIPFYFIFLILKNSVKETNTNKSIKIK